MNEFRGRHATPTTRASPACAARRPRPIGLASSRLTNAVVVDGRRHARRRPGLGPARRPVRLWLGTELHRAASVRSTRPSSQLSAQCVPPAARCSTSSRATRGSATAPAITVPGDAERDRGRSDTRHSLWPDARRLRARRPRWTPSRAIRSSTTSRFRTRASTGHHCASTRATASVALDPWVIARRSSLRSRSMHADSRSVNGEVRQSASTADLHRDVAQADRGRQRVHDAARPATCSRSAWLPIAPRARAGDRVAVEIDGLGRLENELVAERRARAVMKRARVIYRRARCCAARAARSDRAASGRRSA